MYTTLNAIRKHQPCKAGWETLLKHLGKTSPDDEPLSLLTILDSNGLNHALWCLCAVDGFEKEKLLLGIGFAREVERWMPDESKISLDVFERYANGLVTQKEFDAARAVAARAARAAWAACAARAAAWAAADAADAATAADYAARAAAYASWADADAAPHAPYAAAHAAWSGAHAAAHAASCAAADAAFHAYSTIQAKQETQLRQLLKDSAKGKS